MLPEQQCPSCGATVHRVHTRGLVGRIRKSLSAKRAFQCRACGWHGWLTPMDLGVYTPPDHLEPPDVAAIDSVLGPAADARTAPFSDDL